MSHCLMGWSEIFNFLRVDYYNTDKQIGEDWEKWSKRKGAELIRRGFPIFFLGVIDDEPRLYVPDAAEWLRAHREAELAKSFVHHRERKALKAMKAEQEKKAAEEAGTSAPEHAEEPESKPEAEAVA